MFKTGYYQADTINGIHFLGELLENPETELTAPSDFAGSLDALKDDEIIVAFFDESNKEIFDSINDEYGIH